MKNMKIARRWLASFLCLLAFTTAVPALPAYARTGRSSRSSHSSRSARSSRSKRRSSEAKEDKMRDAAGQVQKAFDEKDLDTLASLCHYPLTVVDQNGSSKEIQSKKALKALGSQAIFTKELQEIVELQGQENVRRAAEIAVAGGHNLLMIGPPGSGKSMTARCMAGILPSPDEEESLEITRIYSVLGLVDPESPLIRKRPFREVHHTATRAALIGGGTVPRPGEISLAHGGILFLDELPEFNRSVLEVLRQPLENREIRLSRTHGTYRFPADFMLVAAMNPCPCGNYPDLSKCRCTPSQIQMYLGRISRPFLDRIDLCVEAPRIGFGSLTGTARQESSSEIRKRVVRVREIQKRRYEKEGIRNNAALRTEDLKRYCVLGNKEKKLMERAFSHMELTARGYHRILRTARTIADLDGEERIRENHLREALSLRMIDEKYWRR